MVYWGRFFWKKHSLDPYVYCLQVFLCCFNYFSIITDQQSHDASITSWFLQCAPGHRRCSGERFPPEWGLSEPLGRVHPPPPSPGCQLDPRPRSPPSAGCHNCHLPARQTPATSAIAQLQCFAVSSYCISSEKVFTCCTTVTVPGAMATTEVTAS